jgi:hypothetical protein
MDESTLQEDVTTASVPIASRDEVGDRGIKFSERDI